MPERVRMTRAQGGWRHLHPDAVIVDRTTRWANPWRIGEPGIENAEEAVRRFRSAVLGFWSGGFFCKPQAHPESYIGKIIRDIDELRGRDLACWCPLDAPCHADVLLELANR